MDKRIYLLALLSCSLFISVLAAQPVQRITCQASYEDGLSVRSSSVWIRIEELNLETRHAKVKLFANIVVDFNLTQPYIECHVYSLYNDYVADLTLTRRGIGYYEISDDMKEKSWDALFRSGPEVYPFDRYEFNVTFAFAIRLDNNTLPEDSARASVGLDWPARAQWDGPLDEVPVFGQEFGWPSISVAFAVQRPIWKAYATLTPIVLMFFIIGLSTLLESNRNDIVYRFQIYLSAILAAIGYYTMIQSSMPPGTYYITTPEALTYGVLSASIFFFASSLVSYRTGVSQVLSDTIAIALSMAVVSFMILTFYLRPYVYFARYTFENFLWAEWVISVMLLTGLASRCVHHVFKNFPGRSPRQMWTYVQRAHERTLDNAVKTMYSIGFALQLISQLVLTYIVSMTKRIDLLGPVWQSIFQLTPYNFELSVLGQLVAILCIYFVCYYGFKRMGALTLRDLFGISLLTVSVLSYINNLYLFPYPQQLVLWIAGFVLCVVIWRLFERIRRLRESERRLAKEFESGYDRN